MEEPGRRRAEVAFFRGTCPRCSAVSTLIRWAGPRVRWRARWSGRSTSRRDRCPTSGRRLQRVLGGDLAPTHIVVPNRPGSASATRTQSFQSFRWFGGRPAALETGRDPPRWARSRSSVGRSRQIGPVEIDASGDLQRGRQPLQSDRSQRLARARAGRFVVVSQRGMLQFAYHLEFQIDAAVSSMMATDETAGSETAPPWCATAKIRRFEKSRF
jgi:hypothetical protein